MKFIRRKFTANRNFPFLPMLKEVIHELFVLNKIDTKLRKQSAKTNNLTLLTVTFNMSHDRKHLSG